MSRVMNDFFAHRTVARWIAYAVTFGLLWALFTDAARGALAGILFATLAVARERGRGRSRRRRR